MSATSSKKKLGGISGKPRWTGAKHVVLLFLNSCQGKDAAFNYIAKGTGLLHQNVVRTVGLLLEEGLITCVRAPRKGDHDDPNRYWLTEKGVSTLSGKGDGLAKALERLLGIVAIATEDRLYALSADDSTRAPPLDPEGAAGAAPDPNPPPPRPANQNIPSKQGSGVEGGTDRGQVGVAPLTSGASQGTRDKESLGHKFPKPSRHPAKPETSEETTFLDLYESRVRARYNDPPETFNRGQELGALRRFMRYGKNGKRVNGLSYEQITCYLTNAFDSGNVFPFYDHPFDLSEFFHHWRRFANGAIHPRPAKKTIADMVKESRRAWADTRKKGNAIVVRQLRPLLDHTGYQLDEANPELSSDFIYQLLCVRDEARVNGKLPKPSVLMSQIIDRCMEKHVPVPTDFIQHRNNLRKEEN